MSSRTPKANIDSWRKLFTFVLFLSVCRNGAGDGREVLKKYSGFGGNDTDRNYRNCRNDSNGGEYRPKGSKNGTGNGKISVLNIRVIVQGDSSHSSVGAWTRAGTRAGPRKMRRIAVAESTSFGSATAAARK